MLCVLVAAGCERESSPTASDTLGQSEEVASSSVLPPLNSQPAGSSSAVQPHRQQPSGDPGDQVTIDQATPEQLREAALKALGRGQDDLAFRLVRQARRVAPDQPEVIFLHALVLGDRHRFHEAIKMLDDLADHTPSTRLPALGQTAQWMVEAGNYDEAEARYRAILKEVPGSPMVHQHLGRLLLQLGRRTEAALHLQYLLQRGELNQEGLRSLLVLAKPFPLDAESNKLPPLNRLSRARQEMALERHEAALELLDAGDDESPAETSLRVRIRAGQGKFAAVRQWVNSQPTMTGDSDGWFAKGCLAASEKEHAEAIRCFSQTLLIDQTDWEAYQRLSDSLGAVDESAAARVAGQRADLIRRTQAIGAKLTMDLSNDRGRIKELVTLLQQLRRPLEVLGWQSVDLVYAVSESALTEAEAEAAFEAIARQRQQLVSSGQHQKDPSFILCGLDANKYPLDGSGS
ncbi:MAG: tetratricopeptide repeat protein [Pirellulales bacterium]|nr:tetratricopeptide repeat protein [Pirellulales bacterium]